MRSRLRPWQILVLSWNIEPDWVFYGCADTDMLGRG